MALLTPLGALALRRPAYRWTAGVLLGLLSTGVVTAAEEMRVTTHEAYVEEVSRGADFDIGDIKAVFALVLASLPERVKVYPTENYFYFTFT